MLYILIRFFKVGIIFDDNNNKRKATTRIDIIVIVALF